MPGLLPPRKKSCSTVLALPLEADRAENLTIFFHFSFGADVNDIFDESNIAADSSGNENLLNTFDFNLLGDDGYKRELKQSSEVEEVPKVGVETNLPNS